MLSFTKLLASVKAKSQIAQIIFLHIPKTAGTSIDKILRDNFNEEEIFSATAGKCDIKTYYKRSLDRFKELTSSELAPIKIIKGHFPFGIIDRQLKECKYFTFIREPLNRIVSEYYFIKGNPNHALYERFNHDLSLEEFALTNQYQYDNLQTRLIAGKDFLSDSDIDEDILKIALINIREYFFSVGITENFESSVDRLAKNISLKNVTYPNIRYKNEKGSTKEIKASLQIRIKQRNYLDYKLYNEILKTY